MANGLLAIFNCVLIFFLCKHIYLINVDAYLLHIYVCMYVHTVHLDVYMFFLLA